MTGRGFIVVLIFSALLIGGNWWSQIGSVEHDERVLFSRLDAAIANSPPDADDVIAAFDLSEECRTESCFFEPGNIGGLRFDGGSLRQRGRGLILVLEDFSGTCIRTSEVHAYYRTQQPRSACSHGGCWYAAAENSWGDLLFGLAKPRSTCISSIVINSTADYRNARNYRATR